MYSVTGDLGQESGVRSPSGVRPTREQPHLQLRALHLLGLVVRRDYTPNTSCTYKLLLQ